MGSLTNFLANRKTPGLALLVPVDQLDEDLDNPRKAFPPKAIEELAQDIAQRGILQPIVVSDEEDRMSFCRPYQRWGSVRSIFRILIGLLH